MNHLETLIIRDCFAASTVILPYFTTAPLLRELRYTTHLQECLPPDSLRTFIARSLCSLRLLELETRKLTPTCVNFTVHPLLTHTPMLTTLIIHYIGDYGSWSAVAEYIAILLNPLEQPLHRFLHHSPQGPFKNSILLPHLQHLELLSTAKYQSIPTVLEMLSRRWTVGSPANIESNSSSLSAATTCNFTKLLSAKIPEQYGGDVMQFLGNAMREGMKVEFSLWFLE
ncbi:hypothetical protein JR316_0013063 [Psilocybe cubensis]|uniref:Uncharacterized protein n=2 Tax=Psilocybe cubensis TaxID=181762 RepID=A0A8H7XRY1_PSICU|nr:hypothetical protein JR316_0013063 [Psilocybe cubensis]KAH9474601.1 hypothetical protein JR316_0013063 [Psilocybe cubensis]